jgi:hypothetical protein
MAVAHLQSLAESNPEIINANTIAVFERMLVDYKFSHRNQAYFMCKLVANTLCVIIIYSDELAVNALETLKKLLGVVRGIPHRAVAEALGSLPVSIRGPRLINDVKKLPHYQVSYEQVCDKAGCIPSGVPGFAGRSLRVKIEQDNKLFVIKLLRSDETVDSLRCEAIWMEYLLNHYGRFPVRFNIPKAVKVAGSYVFRLKEIPVADPYKITLHPESYAISFVVDGDYFGYPNDDRKEKILTNAEFKEVIFRNAYLLGTLSSVGIVHTAPLPLFHNRVQRNRRRDQGMYEWQRAGRLDRWLESCRYPNFGLTGIRDFEHFAGIESKSRSIYRYIGVHILSLLLVSGSYFRNKDSERVGFDSDGKPVDARHLFDKELLKELIDGIFRNYYRGFVSSEFKGYFPVDLDHFVSRMIDEMGVDLHMEEILRPADQNEMTDEGFNSFLIRRGFSEEEIFTFQKGSEDIIINSGPHLGEFNHHISLPELIEVIETMASLCIAGRYCKNKETVASLTAFRK